MRSHRKFLATAILLSAAMTGVLAAFAVRDPGLYLATVCLACWLAFQKQRALPR